MTDTKTDPIDTLKQMFGDNFKHGSYFTILQSNPRLPYFSELKALPIEKNENPDRTFIAVEGTVYALFQPAAAHLPEGINALKPWRITNYKYAEELLHAQKTQSSWSGIRWYDLDLNKDDLILYWLHNANLGSYVFTHKDDFFLFVAYLSDPSEVLANVHNDEYRARTIAQTETLWYVGATPYQLAR